ncbi:MAG TPA: hypothetical protein VF933_01615, partial [Streptosporangiaceae bacterium]
LSPARVLRVNVVDAQARVAQVIVPDYQLSLAIGKEGQNARLAARLTGWKIDIQPDNPGEPAGVAGAASRAAAAAQPAAGRPAAAAPPVAAPGPPDAVAGQPGTGEPGSGSGEETGPGPDAAGTVRGGADAPAR